MFQAPQFCRVWNELTCNKKSIYTFLKAGNKKSINVLKYGNMTRCENSGAIYVHKSLQREMTLFIL